MESFEKNQDNRTEAQEGFTQEGLDAAAVRMGGGIDSTLEDLRGYYEMASEDMQATYSESLADADESVSVELFNYITGKETVTEVGEADVEEVPDISEKDLSVVAIGLGFGADASKEVVAEALKDADNETLEGIGSQIGSDGEKWMEQKAA